MWFIHIMASYQTLERLLCKTMDKSQEKYYNVISQWKGLNPVVANIEI